ncbi:MAG TPA: DUF255 domain-containing protein [Polyangiales bacterium]|nr:DUF255 domain-containing protein [Polyangiales bacterium]
MNRLARIAVLCTLLACHTGTPPAVETSGPSWRVWSQQAFAEARASHKLILLSVQADFCHWCHVMNATTYRDPRVLALLAEHFVLLRADEAERPDLRERYAAWGWPATALLTADAQPIVNLRGHQPAARFAALLEDLVERQRRGEPLTETALPRAVAPTHERALQQLDASYDAQQGGWGTPQKYPFAAPVEHALWRSAVFHEADRQARALQSLQGYAQLIDPVAGGLFQYSLEGVWTKPHYEKLSAIQAGAIVNFSHAYRASADPSWLRYAQQTAGYVLTTLRSPEGAFYASQEADVGHVGEPTHRQGADYYRLRAEQRAQQLAPGVDERVYTNLNGELIVALCELYRADGDARWLEHARRALPGDKRAYAHEAASKDVLYLSDQVAMIRALDALALATFDPALEHRADDTLRFVLDTLQDTERGGFYAHTAIEGAAGVFAERQKPFDENAELAMLLTQRAHIEDDAELTTVARRTLTAISDQVAARGRMIGTYLLALEQVDGPYVMFSIVGHADDPAVRALQQAAYRAYVPQGIVAFNEPEHSRYPYPGKAALYLCSDNACSSPVSDPAQLPAALAAFLADESAARL